MIATVTQRIKITRDRTRRGNVMVIWIDGHATPIRLVMSGPFYTLETPAGDTRFPTSEAAFNDLEANVSAYAALAG